MRVLLAAIVLTVLVGLAVAVPTLSGTDASTQSAGVSQTVTRDFGRVLVGRSTLTGLDPETTVFDLLQSEFVVEGDAAAVDSVEGFQSGPDGDGTLEWSYFVNGIAASADPSVRRLDPGDDVWWDLHDPGVVGGIPAVVGSFPEPFASGLDDRRIPVRVDCAQGADRLCDEVTARLQEAGVEGIARARINSPAGPELLRIVVGTWDRVRLDPTVRQLERGPAESGVYATFGDQGRILALHDERGEVVRALRDGAGLIAVAGYEGQQPIWVVTGTDVPGASAAAAMLQEDVLDRRFALAVADGQGVPLPVQPLGEQPEP